MMNTSLPIPTPEELLQHALDYAKGVADAVMNKGELVAFVVAFMRSSEEGQMVPFALPLPQTGDTPLKRKMELRHVGQSFVRRLRAGAPATRADEQTGELREVTPPEVELAQPLLAVHVVETWYLVEEAGKETDRKPSQSPDRKEGVLFSAVDSTGNHAMAMAPIRRTKRGKALPIKWEDDLSTGPNSESPVLYFLLGMAEEIRHNRAM